MSRHCAFCLEILERAQHCGRCGTRAYCSRECQAKDWVPGKGGQGHKLWCSLKCCEEDVDWEVRATGDCKGEGIFAKKAIEKLAVVIVDGERQADCPYLHTLCGKTLGEKYDRNSVMVCDNLPADGSITAKRTGRGAVYLRAAKFNHSCNPNVGPIGSGKDGVTLFVAARDIAAGEELLFNYIDRGFTPCVPLSPLTQDQNYLRKTHGFVCPGTCVCREPRRDFPVLQAHKLYAPVPAAAKRGDFPALFKAIAELDDYVQNLNISPAYMLQFINNMLGVVLNAMEDTPAAGVRMPPLIGKFVDLLNEFATRFPLLELTKNADIAKRQFNRITQRSR